MAAAWAHWSGTTGQVRVVTGEGLPVAAVEGVEVRRLAKRADEWLWEMRWEPAEPAVTGELQGRWLVAGEGEALGQALRERGAECVVASPERVREAVAGSAAWEGVVWVAGEEEGIQGAVELVQALAAEGWRDAPRLWLVTRGTQVAGGGVKRLAGAALWGLSQVVRHEFPGLQATSVDLSAEPSPGELNALVFPVDPGKLPELVAPGGPIGRISAPAAAATGLPEGVPVIACASDKGAESLGTGCTSETMASLSLGTAASVQTTRGRYFEPLPFMPAYPAALPGQHSPEVQVFRGYWMISWFLREFAGGELEEARARGIPPETLLDRFLREVPVGSLGLMTLPHWGAQLKDPAAKGSMIGLGEAHTRGFFYRSLIEGLGFALRDGLERIERAGRIRCGRIGLAGGAAQSEEICQITADIFGRLLPVHGENLLFEFVHHPGCVRKPTRILQK